MALDGFEGDFAFLASHVLPAYMRVLRAAMESPFSMSDLRQPGVGPVTMAKRQGFARDVEGAYLLLDGRRPVYVGISRHVFERLVSHVRGPDQYTATLAFRMAQEPTRFPGTAAQAMADLGFRGRFDAARALIAQLNAAVVAIGNPLERYVFEAYCALELQTGRDSGGWNTFDTH
jgi:hypothetical protein